MATWVVNEEEKKENFSNSSSKEGSKISRHPETRPALFLGRLIRSQKRPLLPAFSVSSFHVLRLVNICSFRFYSLLNTLRCIGLQDWKWLFWFLVVALTPVKYCWSVTDYDNTRSRKCKSCLRKCKNIFSFLSHVFLHLRDTSI